MDIEEVREQFRIEGESVSCIPLYFDDAVKWLISEHDRLRARLASVEQERDEARSNFDALVCDWKAGPVAAEYLFRAETAEKERDDLRAQLEREKGERERVEATYRMVCSRCHGVGEITVSYGQTPESYHEENIPCPDCVGPIIEERNQWEKTATNLLQRAEQAESALAAAQLHAEGQYRAGMERAAKIADQKGQTLGHIVAQEIRAEANQPQGQEEGSRES